MSSSSSPPATIHSLPDEVLVHIFCKLSLRQKVGLKCVSRRWRASAISALREQKVIGIGSLSVHFYENVRFHSCDVHKWSLETMEKIPAEQVKDLLRLVRQPDGEKTYPLFLMFPKLEVILIGNDVTVADDLLQRWSTTLTCLCVQARNDAFHWERGFRLTCYRGRHVTASLVQSCGSLQQVYCENKVDTAVVRLFRPQLTFLTCDLMSLTDLCRWPAYSGLQSLNLNVETPFTASDSGASICLPAADYVRIQIPFSKAFAQSLIPKKRLVKLILHFTAGRISSADLLRVLHRVTDVRQLSLQQLPGPNTSIGNDVISYVSQTYGSVEELRIQFPGAGFDAATLTSLSTLPNLRCLMVADGTFDADSILNFLRSSLSRSTLQRFILSTHVRVQSRQLTAEINNMTAHMSLRDVRIA